MREPTVIVTIKGSLRSRDGGTMLGVRPVSLKRWTSYAACGLAEILNPTLKS